jgi:uncharacterized protein YndB with AHSA1/START domain
MATNPIAEDVTAREIRLTRLLDAPRELVWRAWTEPEQVAQWWGPLGFTSTILEMDVRPGGVWRLIMRGPDGAEYPNRSVFLEVVKPERLIYDHGWDQEGAPAMFRATVTFDQEGDKTRLTMHSLFPTAAARDEVVEKYYAIEGGNQTLDRLETHLATMQR